MQKKICVITGTRAEFGIWQPVLRAIENSRKLRLQLVVTGMHLQREFGYTVNDILLEGIAIAARVPMYKHGEAAGASLARATAGMTKAFTRLKPDLVMVLGDRLEILAAANAALACQIPLAHLHGGETAPAQWDEQIRHAVTKIAHLHFPATKKSGERIARMGENPAAIHVVGAPALDGIAKFVQAGGKSGANHDPDGPVLMLLHPSSADEKIEERRARIMLAAVKGRRLLAIGPNNDPGHRGILRGYAKAGCPVRMSVRQEEFWRLMAQASALVGNSSAGILEAASLGLPVINLGDRQRGRQRNVNVIDVPWSAGRAAIARALDRAQTDQKFLRQIARRNNIYGDGHAARRIVRVLEGLQFPMTTVKQFYDH